MSLALAWAAKGMNTTMPNPRVGCVITQRGIVIGAGHTQPAGQAHAEVQALADARAHGHAVRGATLYVTLEPCSHYGRTPPCVEAVVQAGIARVVVALADPNPLVAGQGLARLQAAGIEVITGLMREAAEELNIGFLQRMRTGRPWVRLKVAASLDGRTALHNGQSQWITSAAAREDGHRWRARACAILTGIGTVKADNPQLTVRAIETSRQPQRIILDSALEIDPSARVLQGPPCWIISAQPNPQKEDYLKAQGHEVLCLPNQHGKVNLPALMLELGRRQINELHVEAGVKLNGSLVREACVDELLVYLAPALLGDAQGMFNLPALTALSGRHDLRFHQVEQVGADLRILVRFE